MRTGARKRCGDRANNREAKLIGRVELTFPRGTRTAELETDREKSASARDSSVFMDMLGRKNFLTSHRRIPDARHTNARDA